MLIDNGLGDMRQDDKFFSHYEPHGDETLVGSLKAAGYTPDDITDVFLTPCTSTTAAAASVGTVPGRLRTGVPERHLLEQPGPLGLGREAQRARRPASWEGGTSCPSESGQL